MTVASKTEIWSDIVFASKWFQIKKIYIKLLSLRSRFQRRLLQRQAHGAKNLGVAGAAAKIARQIFADLVVRWVRNFFEERLYRQHKPRRAVGALQCPLCDKSFLDAMQLVAVTESFEGQHMASRRAHRK